MNPRRTWAVARKETLHVLRDWRSMLMAIAIPVLQIVLFGWALTLDVDRVPLSVWDRSETPSSRELIARFSGSRYFTLARQAADYDTLLRALDTREAMVALTIPEDFAEKVAAGRPCAVQCIADGSDSNTATLALGYAESLVNAYSQNLAIELIQRRGLAPPSVPVDVEPRVWFNEDLESKNNIIPGIIAVIMSMIAALLTSLTIAREWEHGTMEQLASTPVRGTELVLGKLIPYFGLGMLNMTIAVGLGVFVFGVPLRGSVVLLFGISSVFLFVALAQGMLISIVTRNQLLASQAALLTTFLPAFLLSGFAFAITNMPVVLQYLTYIVPARYFVTLLKGIFLKGVGLDVLGMEAWFLTLYCLFLLMLCVLLFRKKMR